MNDKNIDKEESIANYEPTPERKVWDVEKGEYVDDKREDDKDKKDK